MIAPELLIQSRSTIERLLDMTEEQHNEMIFEVGMQYMDRMYGGPDSELYKFYAYDADTWNWFKYQWHKKNLEILLQLGFNPMQDSITNELELCALKEMFDRVHTEINNYPAKAFVC